MKSTSALLSFFLPLLSFASAPCGIDASHLSAPLCYSFSIEEFFAGFFNTLVVLLLPFVLLAAVYLANYYKKNHSKPNRWLVLFVFVFTGLFFTALASSWVLDVLA